MPTKPKAPTSQFVCSNCGYTAPKWLGKCPDCGNFNTMQEELVRVETPTPMARAGVSQIKTKALPLSKIGFEKFDRVKAAFPNLTRCSAAGLFAARSSCSAATPVSANPRF